MSIYLIFTETTDFIIYFAQFIEDLKVQLQLHLLKVQSVIIYV